MLVKIKVFFKKYKTKKLIVIIKIIIIPNKDKIYDSNINVFCVNTKILHFDDVKQHLI